LERLKVIGAKESVTLNNRILACEAAALISNGIKGLEYATWVAAVQMVVSYGFDVSFKCKSEIAEFRCGRLVRDFFEGWTHGSNNKLGDFLTKLMPTLKDAPDPNESVVDPEYGTILAGVETAHAHMLQLVVANEDEDIATGIYMSRIQARSLGYLLLSTYLTLPDLTTYYYCSDNLITDNRSLSF
jgi:hypothetical protein